MGGIWISRKYSKLCSEVGRIRISPNLPAKPDFKVGGIWLAHERMLDQSGRDLDYSVDVLNSASMGAEFGLARTCVDNLASKWAG